MRSGDFEAAWIVSDTVLRKRLQSGQACWHWPRHLQFVWRGDPLDGRRVLVRCYHGLGDTIHFIRFAEPLRRIAGEVIVWVQPALLPLVARAAGVDRAIPLHDGVVEAEFDIDIELMELPHALRTSAQTIPARVPYLAPIRQTRPLNTGQKPRIGIVWEAGDWDRKRSVPIRLFERLSALPWMSLFSLQRGPARKQAMSIGAVDISSDNVEETAARMQQLDLIISVDTMAAHLAGALGRPTWVLLHADCDWRWMRDRSDSPWYPTMRLFRQQRYGDWNSALDAVVAALGDLPR